MPLPHRHHQKAAEGWLMLGNPIEAMAELDLIPDIYRQRMDVLTLHWTVCSALRRWDEAWTVANAQWALYPEAVESWIHRSYAARRHTGGSIAKAFGLLEPAVDRFPQEPILRYNLACYLARMGQDEEAWQRFQQALERGDPLEFRTMALADEDLQSLWPRIALMS
ncbi:MAG: tetratricopeptide repeat protein [Proteobacteria bacterium]|jgi:tetratricopeptide (TPR) repeat protein|nr:tetratricopeptide repeat protein [Pseudomonadota bacterium]